MECGNLLPLSKAATCRGQLEAAVSSRAATSRHLTKRYQVSALQKEQAIAQSSVCINAVDLSARSPHFHVLPPEVFGNQRPRLGL
jgi:hypothetical protein